MEALDDALLIVLRGAEDEVAHSVDLDPSSFPELGNVSMYHESNRADDLPKYRGTEC
jgi:hypothetical protein